jgi:hypothetical protein
LSDLWDNKKPAAADTAAAGDQNNSNQNDEEIIDFDFDSDAETEAQARQLTTKELDGEYEVVENTTPAAASPSTTALHGMSTAPTTATAQSTTGGNAASASQPRQYPAETSDSALLKAVEQRWLAIKGD